MTTDRGPVEDPPRAEPIPQAGVSPVRGTNSMQLDPISRWALIILATIGIFAALWAAQPVLAPVALAFMFAVMLTPLSDFWHKLGLPVLVSSLLSLLLGLGVVVLLVLSLEPVAVNLYEQAPRIRWELRDAVSGLQGMIQGLDEVSEEVSEAISPDGEAGAEGDSEKKETEIPQVSDALFLAPAIAGQVMVFAGGLYFFLLCREDVYRWLAQFTRGADEATLRVFRSADNTVSRYLLAISVINAAFGVAVGVSMHIIGMPGAVLWGFVAALMNFIVYLGPALVAIALALAGTVVFDGPYSFAAVAAFVGLNVIEGQFATPTLLGRHMRVNPLLVFLSLCFWLWLWGPIGGIVAIPLLVWTLAVGKGLGLDIALAGPAGKDPTTAEKSRLTDTG